MLINTTQQCQELSLSGPDKSIFMCEHTRGRFSSPAPIENIDVVYYIDGLGIQCYRLNGGDVLPSGILFDKYRL